MDRTQYSTSSQILRATNTEGQQRYGTGLSQDTIVKIDELRRLMNKYPNHHMNPDVIIQWAIHSCLNGDNTFLDDKLEQLRTIDRSLNGWS